MTVSKFETWTPPAPRPIRNGVGSKEVILA